MTKRYWNFEHIFTFHIHIAVGADVVGGGGWVLVASRFLKCAPIGRTAVRPHLHWLLDSTHHRTQTKLYGHHLDVLMR